MLLGTQFKNGLGTNPAMGRAPQRGFYMYFPRFKELGFIPEARIEAAIKQMENSPEIDNACVLGLRAALMTQYSHSKKFSLFVTTKIKWFIYMTFHTL